MTLQETGRVFIATSALATITIPVGVDGVLFAKAHMDNLNWLPHAKLHCGMSFFAAISLGVSSLALLREKRPEALPLAAWLATSFWGGLIASGLWHGASYGFRDDPVFADIKPPRVLGVPVDINVAIAVFCIIMGWTGLALAKKAD